MGIQLDFATVLERWPSFLGGAVLTLELAALATVLGALLGTFAAVGRGTQHGREQRKLQRQRRAAEKARPPLQHCRKVELDAHGDRISP